MNFRAASVVAVAVPDVVGSEFRFFFRIRANGYCSSLLGSFEWTEAAEVVSVVESQEAVVLDNSVPGLNPLSRTKRCRSC